MESHQGTLSLFDRDAQGMNSVNDFVSIQLVV